jgi:hypothetical protein
MRPTVRDVVVGIVAVLAFPFAIQLTHLTSSEPGSPGEPSREIAVLGHP